jgi:hypothetical protein
VKNRARKKLKRKLPCVVNPENQLRAEEKGYWIAAAEEAGWFQTSREK